MKRTIQDWRKSGDYLPDFLRDFHDQKDFFKAMHDLIDVEEHQYAGKISWVDGHCYTIDIFLWFLSRFGYKIQKSSANVDFQDLGEAIRYCNDKRLKSFAKILEPNKALNGDAQTPGAR
jgi:hypothetical protein